LVRSFLVESYMATRNPSALDTLVGRARSMQKGRVIRHLGSLVLLEDEVCFHVFEAPSAAALLAASEEAGLPCERVTETIWRPGARRLERS
jgi:hypothetical protein